ncbi:MAG: modification methylase [Spirochaetes bacterium GWF1_51_8]|nr:MAG: modification methylase [Spirochaetes bacterium GWF1_51_8]
MSVFSLERDLEFSHTVVNDVGLPYNKALKMEGLEFLSHISDNSIPVCFFDPQYRGIMDKMNYGNEGVRQKLRAKLEQMSEEVISEFIKRIHQVMIPSGHLFLWIDKFHLCEGFGDWLKNTSFRIVDLITWDKQKMGMGYRTRRQVEYLVVIQKEPQRAKGAWKKHDIPDVWSEKVKNSNHAHPKPIGLQKELILATSNENDIVLDPAAGTFSVMNAAIATNRRFIGCDISYGELYGIN